MKITVIVLSIIALGLAGSTYYLYDANMKIQGELEDLHNTKNDLTFQINNLEKDWV